MSETTIIVPHDSPSDVPTVSQSQATHRLTTREWSLVIVLGLVAVTMLLYRPTLHQFFQTYDDPPYVVENPHVQRGLSWANVHWAFTATEAANWHPITWLSHMADVQAFGMKPMGHHLDSMLWHALNVVLLFFLLRAATGYLWRSATVAALFAVCPLNVECVAWVAERKSLISTTFLLLALFAYGWYVRRPNVARYLAVAVLFALGLMAKPMVVTLPVLLLLVDYWPLERFSLEGPFDANFHKRFGLLALEKVPLLMLSAASSAITMRAQGQGGALGWSLLIPFRYRVKNAIYSYVLYIAKAFWPSHLAAFYPHPGASLGMPVVIGAGLVFLAITAAVWRYRRKRVFLVCWAWYVVTLLPVIGIIQVGPQGWADRYAYMPFIAVFVAIVWAVADLANVFSRSQETGSGELSGQTRRTQKAGPVLAVLAIAAVSAYAWVSHDQIGYWNDSYTLFSHAAAVTPRNGMAEGVLGLASLGAGRLDMAEQQFRAAADFMPGVSVFRYDLGVALEREGKLDDALVAYEQSALLGDGSPAYNAAGSILLRQNELKQALAAYNAALRVDPNDPESLAGRGAVEFREGQFDAAVADLTKSVQLSPAPDIYYALGRACEGKGDVSGAAAAYERVLAINPAFSDAASRLHALRHK